MTEHVSSKKQLETKNAGKQIWLFKNYYLIDKMNGQVLED